MTSSDLYLDPGFYRCLAHDVKGRPNGCDRADDCLRHIAIRYTTIDAQPNIARRACCADYDKLISRSTLDGDAA